MRNKRRLFLIPALLMIAAAILVPAIAEEAAEGSEEVTAANGFINTFWALVPPIVAIILALLTKEVYSSLFVGILSGGLLGDACPCG